MSGEEGHNTTLCVPSVRYYRENELCLGDELKFDIRNKDARPRYWNNRTIHEWMSNIPDPFIKTNSRIPLQGRAPELHNYNQPGALQKPGMNTPSQAAPTDSGQHAQMTRKILPDLAFSSPQLQYVGNQHGGPQKMPTVKADPVAEEKDSVDAQDVKRRKDTEFHNYVPDMI